MSALTITSNAASAIGDAGTSAFSGAHAATLPTLGGARPAAWDILSALNNAKTLGMAIGAGVITLAGLILVIVAVVFLAKKFISNQQSQSAGWAKIIVMGLLGGALMAGGIVWVINIAEGGKTTLDQLGTGFVLFQSALSLLG